MPDRAARIANLLLREGSLNRADNLHIELYADIMADPSLYAEVKVRVESVGYELVQRMGHLGVRLSSDAVLEDSPRNRMELHAGHIRLLVYLWTQLVYREWMNLRHDLDTLPDGREQGRLFEADEPPWIRLSTVQAEYGESASRAHLKGLLARLRVARFIKVDERADRIEADSNLYVLIDPHRMEALVVDLARRMGTSEPEAVKRVATGSPVPAETSEETP